MSGEDSTNTFGVWADLDASLSVVLLLPTSVVMQPMRATQTGGQPLISSANHSLVKEIRGEGSDRQPTVPDPYLR